MKEITIVIPESFSSLAPFSTMINSSLDYLKKRDLELFLVVQKDELVMSLVREKLLSIYSEELKQDNENSNKSLSMSSFGNLLAMILGSRLDMTEGRNILFPLKNEAISTYLEKFDFPALAEAFVSLMEKTEDDNDHFIVDVFAKFIIEKVSNDEPLNAIEKVCINPDDYCWKRIGSKVQKKLGIKFSK